MKSDCFTRISCPSVLRDYTQTKPTKEELVKSERKYLPTLSELIDRLTIVQQKELKIPEHRDEYTKELEAIIHDIEMCLISIPEDTLSYQTNAKNLSIMLRDVIVLTLMNCEIWHNESLERQGKGDGSGLRLSHSLNGIRNTAKNKIQEMFGGRKDYKIDSCRLFKEWLPSGYNLEDNLSELQETISKIDEKDKK